MADMSLEEGVAVLERRTSIVRIVIFLYIATSALAALSEFGQLSHAIDIDVEAPDALSMAAAFSLIAYGLFIIASIVVIALWIYRAHANLRVAQIDGLEFTPGWAVGWYFIPIANLFKPFQAMRELWTASLRETSSYVSDADPRLTIWWGLWVAGNIVSNIGLRFDPAAGASATATGLILSLVSTLLLAGAAVFLLRIVTAVNAAQRSIVGTEGIFA